MKEVINIFTGLTSKIYRITFACGLISLLSATNAGALIVDLSDIANGSASRSGTDPFVAFPAQSDGALSVSYNGFADVQAAYEFALPVELSGSELTSSTLTLRFVGQEGVRTVELLGYSGDGVFSISDISDNQFATVVDSVVFDFTGGMGTRVVDFDVKNFLQQLADASATHAGFLLRERPAPGGNLVFMRVRTGAEDDGPAVNIDFEPATLHVQIDIKPNGDPNSINLCSGGSTPVAIFGSVELDVTQVDETSLTLADSSVRVVGKSDKYLCNNEYVNADEYLDIVCQFYTTDLALDANVNTNAELNGNLLDGTPIAGMDSVNLVKDCP